MRREEGRGGRGAGGEEYNGYNAQVDLLPLKENRPARRDMAPKRIVTDKGRRGALRGADGDAVWRISSECVVMAMGC